MTCNFSMRHYAEIRQRRCLSGRLPVRSSFDKRAERPRRPLPPRRDARRPACSSLRGRPCRAAADAGWDPSPRTAASGHVSAPTRVPADGVLLLSGESPRRRRVGDRRFSLARTAGSRWVGRHDRFRRAEPRRQLRASAWHAIRISYGSHRAVRGLVQVAGRLHARPPASTGHREPRRSGVEERGCAVRLVVTEARSDPELWATRCDDARVWRPAGDACARTGSRIARGLRHGPLVR